VTLSSLEVSRYFSEKFIASIFSVTQSALPLETRAVVLNLGYAKTSYINLNEIKEALEL
jgi:hypothetical protein